MCVYCIFIYIFFIILYVGCFGRTMLYMCIEYHIKVNMYHVSAQSVDERMINVHYYYRQDCIWYNKGIISFEGNICNIYLIRKENQ